MLISYWKERPRTIKMNQLFRYLNYTKQAFHQKLDRYLRQREVEELFLPVVHQYRAEHPMMGAREIYRLIRPSQMGRDKFEQLCFENGLKLKPVKSFIRTTNSSGVIRFDNVLAGIELTRVNQAWASDITYFQIGDQVYYLTFIIDLFSRYIVGYSVSCRLFTEQTTIPALKMALQNRNPPAKLIFHSDGGGQYYCKSFLELTKSNNIRNSMAECVYENPHAERINGTIKNQYLKGYKPANFEELKKLTGKAVRLYNTVRPHSSLGKLSPENYERFFDAAGSFSEYDIFVNNKNTSGHGNQKYHIPRRTVIKVKTEIIRQSSV